MSAGTADYTPVLYIRHSIPHSELVALLSLADVAMVSSTRYEVPRCCVVQRRRLTLCPPRRSESLNHSAFEFVCTQRAPNEGVLIYSEFCGGSDLLRDGALIANPYDKRDLAQLLLRALTMPHPERHLRHKKLLRKTLSSRLRADAWAINFLKEMRLVSMSAHGANLAYNGVFTVVVLLACSG